MTIDKQHYSIIGGGMLGLTMAYRLSKKGCQVTLFEADNVLGGQASVWSLGDITWDKHYHIISNQDVQLIALLKELNLENQLVWRETQTGIYSNNAIYPFDGIKDFICFPQMSWIGKIRLGITLIYGTFIAKQHSHNAETAFEWLYRWSGKEVVNYLWKPLLTSKFGDASPKLSATFIKRMIRRMYVSRNSASKKQVFGYVKGGYQTIISALEHALLEQNVVIHKGSKIKNITSDGQIVSIESYNQETYNSDKVLLAVAPHIAHRLCPQFSDEERHMMGQIDYIGIICCSVLLDKPITGNYITNIVEKDCFYTAVIEMSALVDSDEFNGKTLIYLPRYLSSQDKKFGWQDDVLEKAFKDQLYQMFPKQLADNDIHSIKISRVQYVMPLPSESLLTHSNTIKTSVPDIYHLSTANIPDGVLTVDRMIALADKHFSALCNA